MVDKRDTLDAGYYQALHDEHPAFQSNNWLLQDLDTLRSWGSGSLLELGCGNGLFLLKAAALWQEVTGVDWARSPVMDRVLKQCANVRFVQADVLNWRPDKVYDIVASADFLEHLPPSAIVPFLRCIGPFGRRHFHRIACYDDGHSHLSIFGPDEWVRLLREGIGDHCRVLTVEHRKGDPSKLVVTVGGP